MAWVAISPLAWDAKLYRNFRSSAVIVVDHKDIYILFPELNFSTRVPSNLINYFI